ncbi:MULTISPECIES: DUF6037 family protein [Bacillus cereus group]|uniref:DUF6037 family protein n=1 Tax=Bacillus cereus group TaxID=86661 RepID=UPI000BF73828|nr:MULTISPECIES: DUF6037 family protein [Bacillus cereus group]MEB9844509.1 DUF6037 family protein [Bacillus cereus]PEZ14667.1 hypothetical protein CN365_29245 [Bacillus cereus]PFD27875.1 hypothetical protein CN278_29710 [Bacillus thuringiensis]
MEFTEVYEHLDEFCKKESTKSALFNFEYNNGLFTGIYLPIPRSILITCKNTNVSWVLESDKNNNINIYIPNNIYNKVESFVLTKELNGAYVVRPFFKKLYEHLLSLPLDAFKEAPTNLLIQNARTTKTKDVKYDEKDKGDKVYFSHWRRNKERDVSPLNLNKTRRWFGKEIYQYCKKYNVSSVWKAEPSKNLKQHLLYFDTKEAKLQIDQKIQEEETICPECRKPLKVKINSQSKEEFLGCTGYRRNDSSSCSYSRSIK